MKKNYSKDKFGLYLLSKDDIENEVVALLRDYNPELLSRPMAIDIENFAENYLQLNIEYHKLSLDGNVLGLFSFNSGLIDIYDNYIHKKIMVKEKTIIIDPTVDSICEGLFRFTVGHESGHYIAHFDLAVSNHIIEDKVQPCNLIQVSHMTDFTVKRKLTTKTDWMEWQANYISSCLLMNRPAVLTIIEQQLGYSVGYKSEFLKKLDYYQKHLLVNRMEQEFNVSKRAAEIRLEEISNKEI